MLTSQRFAPVRAQRIVVVAAQLGKGSDLSTQVWVGGQLCEAFSGDATALVCQLGAGSGRELPLLLRQGTAFVAQNGTFVSFTDCPPGFVDAGAISPGGCLPCAAGSQPANDASRSTCMQCDRGRFSGNGTECTVSSSACSSLWLSCAWSFRLVRALLTRAGPALCAGLLRRLRGRDQLHRLPPRLRHP